MTPQQKTDAREMLGCGWKVVAVARHYKLKENELRVALGMPVYDQSPERQTLPWDRPRQQRLFD
jgi:hypothetical protein